MPDKPPPASGRIPISEIWEDATMRIKAWIARFRFPYEVRISIPQYDWNGWYNERYDWIMSNIPDPERNVWLDLNVVTVRDDANLVPMSWIKGKMRFRRLEDVMHYKMRWS